MQTTIERHGTCSACGLSVSWHYDRMNRFVGCDGAATLRRPMGVSLSTGARVVLQDETDLRRFHGGEAA